MKSAGIRDLANTAGQPMGASARRAGPAPARRPTPSPGGTVTGTTTVPSGTDMGSGATRAFWRSKGSRSGRRSNTKSMRARRKGDKGWQKMKAWRRDARLVARGESQPS